MIYGKDSIQGRLLYLKLLLPNIEICGYDINLVDGDGNPGQKGDEWVLLKRKSCTELNLAFRVVDVQSTNTLHLVRIYEIC